MSWAKRRSVRLLVAMLVPMLLISIGGFAYACSTSECYYVCGRQPDIEIKDWIVNATNTQDANSNGKIFCDELKITEVKEGCNKEIKGLEITVGPICPEWVLHIILQIYNRPSPYSTKVKVSSAIYYWNEKTARWVAITKDYLRSKFYLQYIDGFYLDSKLTKPMACNYVLNPGKCIYKSEYIKLDKCAPQTLGGQVLTFKVEICAEWCA